MIFDGAKRSGVEGPAVAFRWSVSNCGNRPFGHTVIVVNEKIYFTHIVAGRSHTLYIGMTGNLLKRVFEHKAGTHEGFSSRYNCNRLVWFERFEDPRNAIDREKQLKGWRREKKIALIEGMNPTWQDLSAGWYDLDPSLERKYLAGG